MPICPKCNIEYEEGKKFCRNCGTALVESPSQATVRLPSTDAYTSSWQDAQLTRIVTALRRITEEGGDGNFVIFDTKNYYIQFVGSRGHPVLYGEVVSNECLEPAFRLDKSQIAQLLSMGWNPPPSGSFNFRREWEAVNDSERLLIAREVMRALVEVYGFSHDQELIINLVLE